MTFQTFPKVQQLGTTCLRTNRWQFFSDFPAPWRELWEIKARLAELIGFSPGESELLTCSPAANMSSKHPELSVENGFRISTIPGAVPHDWSVHIQLSSATCDWSGMSTPVLDSKFLCSVHTVAQFIRVSSVSRLWTSESVTFNGSQQSFPCLFWKMLTPY